MSELAVVDGGDVSALDPYEQIGTAIALAETFNDLSSVNNQLEAFRIAAKRQRLSLQDQNRLGLLHIRWTERVGQLRAAIPSQAGKRTDLTSAHEAHRLSKSQADEEVGIHHKTGKKCELVAEIPEEVKEKYRGNK